MTIDKNRRINFRVTDEARALGIRGAYLVVKFEPAKAKPEAAAAWLDKTVQAVRSQKPDVQEDKILAGFRELHTAVKISNRKHVSSPENLIQLILSGRDLPSINPIVDIYNAVSLETRLALGAHDTSQFKGDIVLKLTDGSEIFKPLGAEKPKSIGTGEYAYVDEGRNEIICRLETRQGDRTKVSSASKSCFFIVQGNRETELADIKAAVTKLQALLTKYCGATETGCIFWLDRPAQSFI